LTIDLTFFLLFATYYDKRDEMGDKQTTHQIDKNAPNILVRIPEGKRQL
jgi:hypothetical protein